MKAVLLLKMSGGWGVFWFVTTFSYLLFEEGRNQQAVQNIFSQMQVQVHCPLEELLTHT